MMASLKKNSQEAYHIYVLAMDSETFQILNDLRIENITVFPLEQFENEELLRIKKGRTLAEYCWTCTPALIRHVIEAYQLRECTYLDADLFFFGHPEILLGEVKAADKSVLITPHNYTPFFDQTKTSGIFCVQFMYFKNNDAGKAVLEDWYQKCIDWCFARVEDGKFGDQKYLDVWPEQFPQAVHVLRHQGALAPWNVQRHLLRQVSPIFYHFHGFHLIDDKHCFFGWYPLSREVKKKIYQPYITVLQAFEKQIQEQWPQRYHRTASRKEKYYWLRWARRSFFEIFYFLLRQA